MGAAFRTDDWNLQQIEAMLREKICSACQDRRLDGSCERRDAGSCLLFQKLPLAVVAVAGLNSPHLEPYIESIRQVVCRRCELLGQDGTCPARERHDCRLDLSMPVLVEVIEEHFGRKQARPKPMMVPAEQLAATASAAFGGSQPS
jgi:hypothetical protein